MNSPGVVEVVLLKLSEAHERERERERRERGASNTRTWSHQNPFASANCQVMNGKLEPEAGAVTGHPWHWLKQKIPTKKPQRRLLSFGTPPFDPRLARPLRLRIMYSSTEPNPHPEHGQTPKSRPLSSAAIHLPPVSPPPVAASRSRSPPAPTGSNQRSSS